MKIVFFGNATEKIAAIRYRVQKFADMFEAEGHQCVICLHSSVDFYLKYFENQPKYKKAIYWLCVWFNRWFQLRHIFNADVIFLRGPIFKYGPPIFEYIIHVFNKNMVFDIDDAVWEKPAFVNNFLLRFVDFDWAKKMCKICAGAVVGNRYLEEHVKPWGAKKIVIVPTCIDMEKHQQKKDYPKHNNPVIIGWTGLHTNLGYLDILKDPLKELSKKYPIQLFIASNGLDYNMDGVNVVFENWKFEKEFEYLQKPDIGLMPLIDTPRARGKCAFKALQYMGVGTPVVISPVGMNAEVIEDGVHGFFAQTPEEWYDRLERLIMDPDLREQMGRKSRQRVIELYSFEANYPRLKEFLLDIAKG
ncbi:MAG TPA: glycosyltransferase [Candidatus Hydrogenedens sp.]|nr:glycosyltransferase [Candidatus Hydrogenedens sp.]HOL19257.1 glycosyltransferase [Candidatus Hydrogenedens sp.]HPP58916.1 glycosyltransferase [Candidatus Hydrogenedens sp.]